LENLLENICTKSKTFTRNKVEPIDIFREKSKHNTIQPPNYQYFNMHLKIYYLNFILIYPHANTSLTTT